MRTRLSSLFIFLVCGLAALEADSDIFEEKTFIRNGDSLGYDLDRFLNFKHSSIDFASSNKLVKLPGVPSAVESQLSLDSDLQPMVVKNKLDRVFVLGKDGKTFLALHNPEGKEFKPESFAIGEELAKDSGYFCVDMTFDEKTSLFILCRYTKPQTDPKTQFYRLYQVDMQSPNLFTMGEFVLPAYERPSLKLLSQKPEDLTYSFILFSKSVNEKESGLFKTKLSVIKIKLNRARYFDSEGKEILTKASNEKARDMSIYDPETLEIEAKKQADAFLKHKASLTLLETKEVDIAEHILKENQNLQIQNLMIQKEEGNRLWGSVYEQGNFDRVRFFSCPFSLGAGQVDLQLFDCQVDSEPVKNFFAKEQDYVSTSPKNELKFCTFGEERCATGALPPGWKISRILLENRLAIVIIKIKDKFTLFLNDYRAKEFTWHSLDHLNPEQTYLIKTTKSGKPKHFLMSIEEKSIEFFDITLQKLLKIKKSDLDLSSKVDLTLNGVKIFDLEVSAYDNNRPVNICPNAAFSIVKAEDFTFKLRLPIRGSSLEFTPLSSQKFVYFDAVTHTVQPESPVSRIHVHKDVTYLFEAGSIKIFQSSFIANFKTSENHIFLTKPRKTIGGLKLNPTEIASISSYANIVVVISKKSEDLLLINTDTLEPVKFAVSDSMRKGRDCKLNSNFVVCVFGHYELGRSVEVLKAFEISSEGVEEKSGLSDRVVAFIEKQIEEKREALTGMKIVSYEIDSVRSNSVILFFSFVYDGVESNEFYKFKFPFTLTRSGISHVFERLDDFSSNTDINRKTTMISFDGQVVFLQTEPRYQVNVFEENSSFSLEYVDTNQVYAVETLKTHSLLAVVYRSLMDGSANLILYRVIRNAAKQTIRKQVLPGWNEQSSLRLTELAANVVGVWYTSQGSEVALQAFFEEGPILIGSSVADQVLVNQLPFGLNVQEDASFRSSSLKLINRKLDISQAKSFAVDQHVKVTGHITDIKSLDPLFSVSKPLSLEGAEVSLIGEISGESFPLSASFGENFVVEGPTPSVFVYVTPESKSSLKVLDSDSDRCNGIALGQKSLFCFWQKGGSFFLTQTGLTDGQSTSFEIGQGGHMPKLVRETENRLILARIHESGQFLVLTTFGKEVDFPISQLIDKKKLQTDSLRIADYYVASNQDEATTTSIILDSLENRLHIFHGDLDLKPLATLRHAYSLDRYGAFFRNITCAFKKETNSHVCLLYSDAQIIQLELTKIVGKTVSDFTFKLELRRSFKNVLFNDSFDPQFEISEALSNDNLAIFNRYAAQGESAIYLYGKDSPFSKFELKMEDSQRIKSIHFSKDSAKLIVLYSESSSLTSTLFRKAFRFGDYSIDLSQADLKDLKPLTSVPLEFHFFGDKFDHIVLEAAKDAASAPPKKSSLGFLPILIFALIGVISALLLAVVAGTIYFYVKRQERPDIVQPIHV